MIEPMMTTTSQSIILQVSSNQTMIRRDKILAFYTNKNREISSIIENRKQMKEMKEPNKVDRRQEIPKNKGKKITKKELKESTAAKVVKDLKPMMKTRATCQIEEMITKISTHLNIEKMTEGEITMNLVHSNDHLIEKLEVILMQSFMLGRRWVEAGPDQEATQV